MMRSAGVGLCLVLSAVSVPAQETAPTGDPCASFGWSLTREQAWLSSPGLRRIALGDTLGADIPAAVIGLNRFAAEELPYKSTREPKPGTYAGSFTVPAPVAAGIYQVTLSDDGWVDVFQQGEAKRPIAHTGQKGCAGLRKSLRYQLDSKPFVIQITNAQAETVRVAIGPADDLR